MSFFRMFRLSLKELKNVRSMVTIALLMALSIVLSTYTIRLGPMLEISFNYVAVSAISMLFGPVVNAVTAVISDVISSVVAPNGAFFFWFALNPVVSGIIFSAFFYHRKITLPKVIIAKLIDTLLVNMLMTPFWLYLMYGPGSLALTPERMLKNLVSFVPEFFIMFAVLKVVEQIKRQKENF
mgnify:CR=1 FL=1